MYYDIRGFIMSKEKNNHLTIESSHARNYSQLLNSPVFRFLFLIYVIIMAIRGLSIFFGGSAINPYSLIPHVIIICSITGNMFLERYYLRERAPLLTKIMTLIFEIVALFFILIYFTWMFGGVD